MLSPPPGLSQSATSFIASCRQGIHQTPFSRLIRSGERGSGCLRLPGCQDDSKARPHRSLPGPRPRQDATGLGQCIRLGKTALGCPVARCARCLRTHSRPAHSYRPETKPRTVTTNARPRRGRTGHDAQKRLVFSLFTMSIQCHQAGAQIRSSMTKRIRRSRRSPGATPRSSSAKRDSANKNLVEPAGIEPATPCLQSRCSPS